MTHPTPAQADHAPSDGKEPPCITAGDADPSRSGDWMQTFTGRRFWPLDPRPEDVSIEDIAHALSLLTRYGGHCTRFYSVAEHSVHLARHCLGRTAGTPDERRALALWLLLHDGSEAYLSDMVRPLKRHMPEYRAAEDRVAWAVYEAFRLDPGSEPAEVKMLDNRILMDERSQAMAPTGDTWNYGGASEPLGVPLEFWAPERAEREFLTLYTELTGWAVAMPPPLAHPQTEGGREGLTLTALHEANIARQAEWCPDQVPDLSFRGNELAGETGEACNVIKKLERERQGWRGSRASLADLAEELADVVICADLCAVTAGIDLSAAVVAKFNATSDKVGISVRLAAAPTPTAEPWIESGGDALREAAVELIRLLDQYAASDQSAENAQRILVGFGTYRVWRDLRAGAGLPPIPMRGSLTNPADALATPKAARPVGEDALRDDIVSALNTASDALDELWNQHCKTDAAYTCVTDISRSFDTLKARLASQPQEGTGQGTGDAEFRRVVGHFARSVKALLQHVNPTNVNEGHAQQWFAVADALRMQIEPALTTPAPQANDAEAR